MAHIGPAYYITTRDQWFKHIDNFSESHYVPLDLLEPQAEDPSTDTLSICVVVVAHETKHAELQADPAWEVLPHPLSGRPVKPEHLARFKNHPHPDLKAQEKAAQAKTPGPPLNSFQLAVALSASHPLMGWRIF